MAYNQITVLPRSLLSSTFSSQSPSLETLILDGNPLTQPTLEQLFPDHEVDCEVDVTNFAQIDASLRRFYNKQCQIEANEHIKKHKKNNILGFVLPQDEKVKAKQNNIIEIMNLSLLKSKKAIPSSHMNEDHYNV